MSCPCGSEQTFEQCCAPIIAGEREAPTAEALMRARYTAYTRVETDFLLASLHPDHREEHDEDGVRLWAEESDWHGLTIQLNSQRKKLAGEGKGLDGAVGGDRIVNHLPICYDRPISSKTIRVCVAIKIKGEK